MNDNLSQELKLALDEIDAVRSAIAADRLDRRAAYGKLIRASDLVRRVMDRASPLPRFEVGAIG